MALRFTKMHGLSNDYVYVDLFDQQLLEPPEVLAPRISHRHTGVGSDGLILIEPADAPGADVRMRMYNADGSRSQMCGNGIRCVGKFVYERGRARKSPLRVQTDAGVLSLELQVRDGIVEGVRVDMGAPRRLSGEPLSIADAPAIADQPLATPGVDVAFVLTCVSMGNPHAVMFVGNVDAVPLREWGPLLEWHERFPDRINAHFVQVLSRVHLKMVTWERGAGPTQACGTGACAVAVAAVLSGRCDRDVRIDLPGGALRIEWDEASNHVFKTGPATHVFDGEWLCCPADGAGGRA